MLAAIQHLRRLTIKQWDRKFISILLAFTIATSSFVSTSASAGIFESKNPFQTAGQVPKQTTAKGKLQSCFAFFAKAKNIFPSAKIHIIAAQKQKALSQIVGQVTIQENANSRSTAKFKSEMDINTRINAGSGDALLQAFGKINTSSATTLRVEEKTVIPIARLDQFLAETQTPAFATLFNSGSTVKWEPRDTPRDGYNFTTLTEYGQHLSFSLTSNATFVVKPRYRKYYEFPINQHGQLDKYVSVMGELVAFELKMTSASGPNDGSFMGTEDTVFKPRLMITDALADQLKQLNGHDADFEKKLNAIKSEVKSLKNKKQESVNGPGDVDSIFEALAFFLAIDPEFLKPTHTVHYERTSYRYKMQGSEYQFTADRNVRFYKPADIPSSQMIQYLAGIPVFAAQPGHVFVELKSPVKEKTEGSQLHTELLRRLKEHHVNDYQKGGGKYSLARQVDMTLLDEHLDKTLFEMGTAFWLIEGTANLDTLPKKNEILTVGDIDVAYPFTTASGKIFRLVLRYKSTYQPSAPRIGVLEKVKIIDEFGMEVRVKDNFDALVWTANNRMQDDFLAIDLEGTIIPFKTFLTNKDMNDYKSFFSSFFANETNITGRQRSLDDMNHIHSALRLTLYKIKLKVENGIKWMTNRTMRIAFSAGITTAVSIFFLNSYLANNDNQPPIEEVPQQNLIAVPGNNVVGQYLAYNILYKGFSDAKHGAVDLIFNEKMPMEYEVSNKDSAFYNSLIDGQTVELKTSTGTAVKFYVKNKKLHSIQPTQQ